MLKGFTTRKKDKYSAILGGQTDYVKLDKFMDRRRRAVLTCFCGNDYVNHLYAFNVGNKPETGRRGLAFIAMKKHCQIMDPGERKSYLKRLETDNR